jgi:DNA-directed RNA polymerase specialized sigma24 family protein
MNLEETLEELRAHLLTRLVLKWEWTQEDAEDILQEAWIICASGDPPSNGEWETYIKQAVKSVSYIKARNEKNRSRLHKERWGKIAKGFNLLETSATKLTERLPEQDEMMYENLENMDDSDI